MLLPMSEYPLSATISSNTLIAPIEVWVMPTAKNGSISGSIIFIKICHLLAPSILAASIRLSFIDCLPERQIKLIKGISL